MSARPLPMPTNPALLRHAEQRRQSLENRIADQITRFAGSMQFVYLHIIWFASWIGFRVEHYPFGLLTMIVSLEAIFLSTFVMISQNRADEKRQVLADHQWHTSTRWPRHSRPPALPGQTALKRGSLVSATWSPLTMGVGRRTVASRLYRSYPRLGISGRYELHDLVNRAGTPPQANTEQ